MAMVYFSDTIQRLIGDGLRPVLKSGYRSIRMFPCPTCKRVKMVKFFDPMRDGRAFLNVCSCGMRKATSKFTYPRS